MTLKFNVISDLHLDFYNYDSAISLLNNTMKDIDCDYHIIAGDFCEIHNADYFKLIEHLDSFESPVIYVFGNHEYYHHKPEIVDVYTTIINRYKNINVLNNNYININDNIIYGGTMWFDETPASIVKSEVYPRIYALNDFNYIHVDFEYYSKQNKLFFDKLESIETPDIIVTHHVPHKDMLMFSEDDDKYDMNKFYYCSKAFDYINKNAPKLWICGHTHNPNDITYNNTRIVNNSYGYPKENNKFKLGSIVEL